MTTGERLVCTDCKNDNAREYQMFPLGRDGRVITRINLCIECRLKRLRRSPGWYGADLIKDDILQIIMMRDFLIENDQAFIIPYKQLIEWIAEENWSAIRDYKTKIEKRRIDTLIRKIMLTIDQMLEVPADAIDTDLLRERREHIKKFQSLKAELDGNSSQSSSRIEQIERKIEENKEFLEDLHHAWEKTRRNKIKIMKEELPPLTGLSAYISGRLIGLEKEREITTQHLRGKGIQVKRFEDRASPETPREACLSWAAECDIYIGIFGESYGEPVEDNKSATELELKASTEAGVPRLIFIKSGTLEKRQREFINKIEGWQDKDSIIYTKFENLNKLKERLDVSLNELAQRGIISMKKGRRNYKLQGK